MLLLFQQTRKTKHVTKNQKKTKNNKTWKKQQKNEADTEQTNKHILFLGKNSLSLYF